MKKSLSWFIILIFFLSSVVPVWAETNPPPVPLVAVSVDNLPQTEKLFKEGLDIVRVDPVNREVHVVLGPYEQEKLKEYGLSYDILQEDLNREPAAPKIQMMGFTGRTVYRTWEEYEQELHDIEHQYPHLAKLHIIGYSHQSRPIYALEISSTPGEEDGKPETVHMAMHHAREWPSGEMAMDLAWYLVEQYGSDDRVTAIVDGLRTWIIPMVNPDGFVYSQTQYRMWRKNMRDNGDGTFGVDPNRNYSYMWGGSGSSGQTNSNTYRGPEPFSEPEIQAIRDFYLSRHIITTLTGHTYSELILYPWGYKNEPAPDHEAAEMAREMAQWNQYTDMQSVGLYPTNGDTTDWVYGALRGIGFTFEYGKEFIPPYQGRLHPALVTDTLGSLESRLFTFSVETEDISGQVVYAGLGLSQEDFPEEVRGNIALIERGGGTFREKAQRAEEAGAIAVVIFNNTSGLYQGTLGSEGIGIPVVSISREDGLQLVEQWNQGQTINAHVQNNAILRDSIPQLWELNLPAFLYTLEKAREHASVLSGTIKDKRSQKPIPARLELETDFIIPLDGSRSGQELREKHHTVLETKGSFTWHVLPSRQPEQDNEPYTLRVKAPGYYSAEVNVAIERYGETHQVDLNLQTAIDIKPPVTVRESWEKEAVIPLNFTTYTPDGKAKFMNGVQVQLIQDGTIVASFDEGKGDQAIRRTGKPGNYALNIHLKALNLSPGEYTLHITFDGLDEKEQVLIPISITESQQTGQTADQAA